MSVSDYDIELHEVIMSHLAVIKDLGNGNLI